MTRYRALVGITYLDKRGRERDLEPGATTESLPEESVPWLLEQGLIEEAGGKEAED